MMLLPLLAGTRFLSLGDFEEARVYTFALSGVA